MSNLPSSSSATNHYSIYAQWLSTPSNNISFTMDIPYVSKDVVDQTKQFVENLNRFVEGDGDGRLLVSITDIDSKRLILSKVFQNLPDSERGQVWNVLVRLKDYC